MARFSRIAILSDVHYAGPMEQQRGNDYEYRDLKNPFQRTFCHYYRHFIWLRNPLEQNHLLQAFLETAGDADRVFALGDYSCDTRFVGLSDDGAFESAQESLGILRSRYGQRLYALIGDHELGKFTLFGRRGGLRFESWRRATQELGLSPFWQFEVGSHVCMGITSSLITLPLSRDEILDSEITAWEAEREIHLQGIRKAFDSVRPSQRILLFCHDPTALPFLWDEPSVRNRVRQIERTFVGHLHSPLVHWKSRRLAGLPTMSFLGHSIKKLSTALGRATSWKHFNVQLCPSLAGIQLLKDGGFLTAAPGQTSGQTIQIERHRLNR